MKIRAAVIFLVMLGFVLGVQAQEGLQRAVISPENVKQIKEIGTLGRGWVEDLTWSPNNRVFAVSSSTGIWLYDTDQPDKQPRNLPIEYFQPTKKLQFSPDGSRLVTVEFYRIIIWDVTKGSQIAEFERPHEDESSFESYVTEIRFDKAGHTLVVSYIPDKGYSIDDLDSKAHLYTLPHTDDIPYFSPDISKVALCSFSRFEPNRPCKVWDLTTGKLLTTLQNYVEPVWSPDSSTIADQPSNDGDTIKIWFVADNHQFEIDSGHAYNLRWSPDNKLIAAYVDRKTFVWSATTGEEIAHLDRALYPDMTFSSDSTTLIGLDYWSDYSSNEYNVIVWGFGQTKAPIILKTSSNQGSPYYLAVSPDGQRVAASGLSNLVYIWSINRPNEVPIFLQHNGIPESLAFSAESDTLAVGIGSISSISQGSWDNSIWLWNTADYTMKRILYGHVNRVMTLDFSADEKYLVSGAADYGDSRVWYLETGSTLISFSGGSPGIGAIFSPDERQIAVINRYYFDLSTDPVLWFSAPFRPSASSPPRPPTGLSSRPIAFSNNASVIAVMGTVYDAKTEQLRFNTNTGQNHKASYVAFSPDDRFLAVGQDIKAAVELWDVTKATQEGSWKVHDEFFGEGDQNWIRVSFSPDGKLLAAGGAGNILLIDVAREQIIMTLHTPGNAEVHSIAWSPDGKTLAVGSREGTVKLWGVES